MAGRAIALTAPAFCNADAMRILIATTILTEVMVNRPDDAYVEREGRSEGR